jgi:hypothetical protein
MPPYGAADVKGSPLGKRIPAAAEMDGKGPFVQIREQFLRRLLIDFAAQSTDVCMGPYIAAKTRRVIRVLRVRFVYEGDQPFAVL